MVTDKKARLQYLQPGFFIQIKFGLLSLLKYRNNEAWFTSPFLF